MDGEADVLQQRVEIATLHRRRVQPPRPVLKGRSDGGVGGGGGSWGLVGGGGGGGRGGGVLGA